MGLWKKDFIPLASRRHMAGFVLIQVILGMKQNFNLIRGSIKSQPTLVIGMFDTSVVDTKIGQPLPHTVDGLLVRGEHFYDFIRSPMLGIVDGIWM
jgi:hypothetical protein